jgi:hypothetical protein
MPVVLTVANVRPVGPEAGTGGVNLYTLLEPFADESKFAILVPAV